MRESQGQNRRGTPTGERALQGARLPQGKQVDPRLSAFCFLFFFRPFVRAPCPILNHSDNPRRGVLTKVEVRCRSWDWLAHSSDAKKPRRENGRGLPVHLILRCERSERRALQGEDY